MKSIFKRPIVDASLRAFSTFLLSAVAPAVSKGLAEKLNLFVQLLNPVVTGVIGTAISAMYFAERYFRRSNPALSGVFGVLKQFAGLIYLLFFAEMLTSINIPVTQVLYNSLTFISINYQPIITLAVIAFAVRMLQHSYQILFHEQLKEAGVN